MALIKCTECGKEISEKASACPFCGNPMAKQPLVIEQTDKKWKMVILWSWGAVIFGLCFFSAGSTKGGFNHPLTGLGFSLGSLGVLGIIFGKCGRWWYHR